MILGENIGSVYSKGREIQRVFSYGKLVWEKESDDIYSNIPFTVQAVKDASISLKDIDSNVIKFNYSLNGGEWKTTDTISIKKNDIISIKANNAAYCKISGLSDIYGNIMSLLYGDNYKNQTVWLEELCYESSIDGYFLSSDIRNAKNLILPATTLTPYCYYSMFFGCTSLTTAPELPATTLAFACYKSMFGDCDSLTTAPELPATTLANYCYDSMFLGCDSLTTAPELPATTLATYCYSHMFGYCTSLTTSPELPATTMAVGCYFNMFVNCTSLTTSPELPATTLSSRCYDSMFADCTSLTTSPELPATTLEYYCYDGMFENCTLINYIKCYATNNIESNASGWTNGISTNGKLLCKSIDGGKNPLEDYIPSTWTVEYLT